MLELAVCDIGNSTVKVGIFEDDNFSNFRLFKDIPSAAFYLKSFHIKNVAFCSVVPKKGEDFIREFSRSDNVVRITKAASLKISYNSLETLGTDRICSAEGAFYLYKKIMDESFLPENHFLVSIDFGTCTTINIIKEPNKFIGGMISPGVPMMFNSLHHKTAQLPSVRTTEYIGVIGNSTKTCIASGIISSAQGLIDIAINHLKDELNAEDIKFFITGGNAEIVKPFLKFQYIHEPHLVLIGIKAIYEALQKKKPEIA
jgi:type III pantothenate kinase